MMELLERYLAAVAAELPVDQQQDIIRELRANYSIRLMRCSRTVGWTRRSSASCCCSKATPSMWPTFCTQCTIGGQ